MMVNVLGVMMKQDGDAVETRKGAFAMLRPHTNALRLQKKKESNTSSTFPSCSTKQIAQRTHLDTLLQEGMEDLAQPLPCRPFQLTPPIHLVVRLQARQEPIRIISTHPMISGLLRREDGPANNVERSSRSPLTSRSSMYLLSHISKSSSGAAHIHMSILDLTQVLSQSFSQHQMRSSQGTSVRLQWVRRSLWWKRKFKVSYKLHICLWCLLLASCEMKKRLYANRIFNVFFFFSRHKKSVQLVHFTFTSMFFLSPPLFDFLLSNVFHALYQCCVVTRNGHLSAVFADSRFPSRTHWRKLAALQSDPSFTSGSWLSNLTSSSFKLLVLENRRHHRAVHEEIRPFLCQYCQSAFKKRGKQMFRAHSNTTQLLHISDKVDFFASIFDITVLWTKTTSTAIYWHFTGFRKTR